MMAQNVLDETSMEPGDLEDNLPRNKAQLPNPDETLDQLETLLRQCEENEDYEQAAEIMKRINRMKGNDPK